MHPHGVPEAYRARFLSQDPGTDIRFAETGFTRVNILMCC